MANRAIAAGIEGHTGKLFLKSRGYSQESAECTCGWASKRLALPVLTADINAPTKLKVEPIAALRDRLNQHLYEAYLEARQGQLPV